MVELEFHPLASVFPLIEGEEFEELVASIAERGVDEPIWLYEDTILDGRNRYRAARAAGRECPQRQFEGDDPVAFLLAQNVQRRHLTPAQRADAVAQLVTTREGRPKTPPRGGVSKPLTAARAAKLAGVSPRSVDRALARRRSRWFGKPPTMVSLFPGLNAGRVRHHGLADLGLGDIEAALAEHDRLQEVIGTCPEERALFEGLDDGLELPWARDLAWRGWELATSLRPAFDQLKAELGQVKAERDALQTKLDEAEEQLYPRRGRSGIQLKWGEA